MKPTTRAPKPNQHERAQRQGAIDVLLQRALRGKLTIPEAAVLADYVRAERRLADQTRLSLGHTTRTLERHRAAADAEIQRLEARAERAETEARQYAEAESADIAAGSYALRAETVEAQIASVREAAAWIRRNYPGLTHVHERLTAALDDPADGPTVAECADNNRLHWDGKYAGDQS